MPAWVHDFAKYARESAREASVDGTMSWWISGRCMKTMCTRTDAHVHVWPTCSNCFQNAIAGNDN